MTNKEKVINLLNVLVHLFLGSWIVQLLWNGVVEGVILHRFGNEITYWQAMGIVLLCEILFAKSKIYRETSSD